MLAHRQADILRQRRLCDIGEWLVRAPTLHVLRHFAAGPRSTVKHAISLIIVLAGKSIINIVIYNVFANNAKYDYYSTKPITQMQNSFERFNLIINVRERKVGYIIYEKIYLSHKIRQKQNTRLVALVTMWLLASTVIPLDVIIFARISRFRRELKRIM